MSGGDGRVGDTLRGYLPGLDPATRRFGHAVRKQLERLEGAFLDGETGDVFVSGDLVLGGEIRSDNYEYVLGDFTEHGSELDLTLGNFRTPGLWVDGVSGNVAVRGDITATALVLSNGVAQLAVLDDDVTVQGVPSHALQLLHRVPAYTDGGLYWSNDTVTTAPQVALRGPTPTTFGENPPRLVLSANADSQSGAVVVNGNLGDSPTLMLSLSSDLNPTSPYSTMFLGMVGLGGINNRIDLIHDNGDDSMFLASDLVNITAPLIKLREGRLDITRFGAGDDEFIRLNGGGADGSAAGTQPFISFYGGSSATRAGYIGFPSTTDDGINLVSDKGPVSIIAATHVGIGSNLLVADGWRIISQETYDVTSSLSANVGITTNGFFFRSTSSARYKRDIEDLTDDYADLLFDLRPVWYRSTAPQDVIDGRDKWGFYGLIAEEVAEVDPRLVQWGENADGELVADGVMYDRLVPHLISIIKRLDARVSELEAR